MNSIAQTASMLLDMRSCARKLVASGEQGNGGLGQGRPSTGTQYEFQVVGDRRQGSYQTTSPLPKGTDGAGKELGHELNVGAASTDSNIPLSRGWPAVTMGFRSLSGDAPQDQRVPTHRFPDPRHQVGPYVLCRVVVRQVLRVARQGELRRFRDDSGARPYRYMVDCFRARMLQASPPVVGQEPQPPDCHTSQPIPLRHHCTDFQ